MAPGALFSGGRHDRLLENVKMKLITYILLAALAAMSLASPSLAAAAPPAAETILRALADRLLDEAERQHMVNRRMDTSVRGFDALVRDLISNDLLAQGRGGEMKRFVKVLTILNTRHVPNAEKYLTEARKRLAALHPNLRSADGEIKIILRLLDELLKKAEADSATDDLLTRLRLIIRNEENLHRQTREWGKLVYQKPKEADSSRDELKTRQQQIAANVRRFEQALTEAARSDEDPIRKDDLTKAERAMKQEKPDKKLDKAADQIGAKKPVGAVRNQQEALEALRELEKMLESDSLGEQIEEWKASYEDLEEILARQEELTNQTRQTPREQFDEKSDKQEVEQRNIERELSNTRQQMPEAASEEVQQTLKQAEQHMEKAAEQMQQDSQQPAVKQQEQAEEALKQAMKTIGEQIEAAEAQLAEQQEAAEAAEALEQAMQQAQSIAQRQQQLMQQTAQAQQQQLAQLAQPQGDLAEETGELAEETGEAGEALEEASGQMEQAQASIQQGQQAQAQQHQAAAIAALQQATQSMQQAMSQQTSQVNPNSRTNRPDERGSRDFGKQKPRGKKPSRDKRLFDHLTPKQREAVKQAFARDLPPEYRELLEDYYEALSK